jgi:hypothetical protein
MWGILEPISAGLIVALINRYLIGINPFELCETKQEDNDDENISISTTVSDSSSIQHIHMHVN